MKRFVVVLVVALLAMPVFANEGKHEVNLVQHNAELMAFVKKTDNKKRMNKRRKRACHRWARKCYAG